MGLPCAPHQARPCCPPSSYLQLLVSLPSLFILLCTPKGVLWYLPGVSPRTGRILRLPKFPRLAEFHHKGAMSTGGSTHPPTLLNKRAGAGLYPYYGTLGLALLLLYMVSWSQYLFCLWYSVQSAWNNVRVELELCKVTAWNGRCLWHALGTEQRHVEVFEGAKFDEILPEDCVRRQTWYSILHVTFWKWSLRRVLGTSLSRGRTDKQRAEWRLSFAMLSTCLQG